MRKIQVRQFSHGRLATFMAFVMLALIAAVVLMSSSALRADDTAPVPSPDYPPEQVVKIIIESLQENTAPDDQGIATVYQFASPLNRANTGPVERFTQMVKVGYPDMLNHQGARYDPMEVSGSTAVQAVWLKTDSGKEVGYAFQLTRQESGEYESVWMTDAVVSLGEWAESGIRI